MQKILKLFKESKIIKKYSILDFNSGQDFYYLKAKLELIDSTFLFIREFISSEEHIYSYHLQDAENNLITRWDNAPHHKELKTYPHHKHTPNVSESYEINIQDVLKYIEKNIIPNKK
ncbi:MAG: hypothetical protein EAX96_21415 [Candidatus Lokiarchaeota archaeon]|nr:hypothetical protein [Candidatus Lokiarchaeota archaeon]